MINQSSQRVEKSCDESRWEIHSPETVSYVPSKLILAEKNLPESVINLSIKELSNDYKKFALNEGSFKQESRNYMADAIKYGVMLLFSKSSLKSIWQLFIDQSNEITDAHVGPDELYEAFSFLKEQLTFINMKKKIDFHCTALPFNHYGFASTEPVFLEDGTFNMAKMEINNELYRISKYSQFSQKAKPFTALNIAHELIHVLVASTYGLHQPKSNQNNQPADDGKNQPKEDAKPKPGTAIMTPEKSKFKIKVASSKEDETISEPGFAWERLTFGAISFASYKKESVYEEFKVTDIALDFFGTQYGNNVSGADESWLQELVKGCEADVYIQAVPHNLIYSKHQTKEVAICRNRTCKPVERCIRR